MTPGPHHRCGIAGRVVLVALVVSVGVAQAGNEPGAAAGVDSTWESLHESAKESFLAGRYKQAGEYLQQALVLARDFGPLDRRYAQTLSKLAHTYRLRARPQRALEIYHDERARLAESIGAADPRLVPLLLGLGVEYRKQHRWEEAEDTLRYALSLVDPPAQGHRSLAGEALVALANLYVSREDADNAIRILERLVRMFEGGGRQVWALRQLAPLYADVGDVDRALETYARVLERQPDDERLRAQYVELLRRQGRDDEARAVRSPPALAPRPAAPDPVPGEILHAGKDGVGKPRLVRRVPVRFPERARRERVSGEVVLTVVVARDGTVRSTEVVRCSRPGYGFEEAAHAAVVQWRYEPATRDGLPVDVYTPVMVNFEVTW